MSKRGNLAETQRKLANLRGQDLTEKQLKEMFGYSPHTYIRDTFLYHEELIEQVKGTSPTLWRVQSAPPLVQALPAGAGQTAHRIVELVAHGEYTQQQLGDLVGVSHERVGQIIRQFGIHYRRPSRPSRKRCCIICGEPLRKPYRKVKGIMPPCHQGCRVRTKRVNLAEEIKDAVVRDYGHGVKVTVIQVDHKVNPTTMYRILHERGVKLDWHRGLSMAEVLRRIELAQAEIKKRKANIKDESKRLESAEDRLTQLKAERDSRSGVSV